MADEIDDPVRTATFRVLTALLAHLIETGVVGPGFADKLKKCVDQASSPDEALILRSILQWFESDPGHRPPDLRVIMGGKPEE